MVKVVVLVTMFSASSALDNGVILTPPMGWSSWNKFRCGISSKLIREIADAVKSSGLLAHGYNHINLDDCWMAMDRDKNGHLQASPDFPEGMSALGDYLHGKGMKYGLYLDPGTMTCQRRPGTQGHEKQDAQFLASVGCDYVKHDACYDSAQHQLRSYFDFRDALNATGRAIGYSICPDRSRCNDPANVMWDASSVANVNMCRGDAICKDFVGYPSSSPRIGDIIPTWHSWLCMLDVQAQFNSMQYAGPGHYVMPDMLEVGNGMTPNEDRAHFSMWVMIAAPLIMGQDVRNMTNETLDTLSNHEVIAIDQDRMGKPAHRVKNSGYEGQDVWVRQLWNGEYAVALFNRAPEVAANITLEWADVGLPKEQPAALRDLWAGKDLGQFTNAFSAEVPAHSVMLLRISQRALLATPPAAMVV